MVDLDTVIKLDERIAVLEAALRLAWSRLDPAAETDETIAIIEAALAPPAREVSDG